MSYKYFLAFREDGVNSKHLHYIILLQLCYNGVHLLYLIEQQQTTPRVLSVPQRPWNDNCGPLSKYTYQHHHIQWNKNAEMAARNHSVDRKMRHSCLSSPCFVDRSKSKHSTDLCFVHHYWENEDISIFLSNFKPKLCFSTTGRITVHDEHTFIYLLPITGSATCAWQKSHIQRHSQNNQLFLVARTSFWFDYILH